MALFTFLLDASIHNAFELQKEIEEEKASDLKEFKRTVAAQLCEGLSRSKKESRLHEGMVIATTTQPILWMVKQGGNIVHQMSWREWDRFFHRTCCWKM